MVKLKNLSRVINACVFMAATGLTVSGVALAANPNLQNASNEELLQAKNNSPATAPFGIAGLGVAPLVMLTVGREHNLFTEAYSDYTDIDGDGQLDIMFDPSISYYGLFDPKFCYKYQSGTSNLTNVPDASTPNSSYSKFPGYWYPVAIATDSGAVSLDMWANTDRPSRTVKICSGTWSGNFLNYVTASRIDVIRKVLYGGTRVYSSTKGSELASGSAKTTKYNGSSLLAHSRVIRDSHSWGKVFSDLMYDQKFRVSQFTDLTDTGNAEDAWFFVVASPDSPNQADNNDGNDNSYRWSTSYLRYAKVHNAGMPGRAPSSQNTDPAYIWDWASRQTFNQDSNDAIGSKNQKKIDRSKKTEGSTTKNESLFSSTVQTRGIAVVACTEQFHDNDNCYNYGTEAEPIWQPIGLLQQYGQGDKPRMKFGLISGGWEKNIQTGILRANIGDFNSEIHYDNTSSHVAGDFNFGTIKCSGVSDNGAGAICGIVATFDRMNISAKESGSSNLGGYPNGGGVYNKCSRSVDDTLVKMYNQSGGRCHDWGNPVGKMLYQTAKYFKGVDLDDQKSDFEEAQLKIGHVTRSDPYPKGSSTYCAKPVSLLIADENISFDSNYNNSTPYSGDTSAILGETASVSNEYGLAEGSYFMGQVSGKDSGEYEFIPSRKHITNLSQVIGLAPSVAFSFGSYNVAGVASLYSKNKLRESEGPNGKKANLYLSTYVVAMKPNVPQINIPVTTKSGKQITVELLPFAKTPCDYCNVSSNDSTKEIYLKNISKDVRLRQSTNQVADFYVESLGADEGVFRVSYEDFEYGSDYDMDWVVGYKYKVIQGNKGTYIRVMLSHEDGDPYAPQHAGYVITGVENEGVYMDLGKLSSKSTDKTGCNTNMYELDTVINDVSIDSCRSSYWNMITDKDHGLTQVAEKGKTTFTDNMCLFPYYAYTETSYNYAFWSPDVIDSYYDTYIAPHAAIYYGNRRALYDAGYKQYAIFKDMAKNYNARLHGDRLSSMGKHATDNNLGVTTSRLFKVDESKANGDTGWLKSPLWFAAKYGINPDNSAGRKDPKVEPDNYYLVTNPVKMRDGIAKMLNKIDQTFKSGSSFVAADAIVGTEGSVYGTSYDPSTWYGAVSKRGYTTDEKGNISINGDVEWNAAKTFAATLPDDRVVITLDSVNHQLKRFYATEIPYNYNTWTSDKSGYAAESQGSGAVQYLGYDVVRQILNENSLTDEQVNDPDYLAYADKLVRWVLGDHKYEGLNTSDNYSLRLANNENKPLRYRSESITGAENFRFVLADVINSDVVAFTVNNSKYLAVGANDGMLHILNEADGKPIVSYLPSAMLPHLGKLVKETYNTDHQAYVDSTPKVLKSGGKVYLYGTYGLGVKGAYLLNVSAIDSIANSGVDAKLSALMSGSDKLLVWELKEEQSQYIGKQRVAPAYVRVKTSEESDSAIEYFIFASGYDAAKQGLTFVDIFGQGGSCISGSLSEFTPCIIGERDVAAEDPWGYGRTNAFGPLQLQTSSSIDEVGLLYNGMYWGDLFGNLWKLDLKSLQPDDYYNVANWVNAEPRVIFRATDSNGVAQPITTKVAIDYHPGGGVGLIFGTGGLWTTADQGTVSLKYNTTQTIYVLRDLNTYDPSVNASNRNDGELVHRCANPSDVHNSGNAEGCLIKYSYADGGIKVDPAAKPNEDTKLYGWYLDLADDNLGSSYGSGARIYRDPKIINSYNVAFAVNVPSVSDTCSGGGTSYMLYGDWTLTDMDTVVEVTAVKNYLTSEISVYYNADGSIAVRAAGSEADEDTEIFAGGPNLKDPIVGNSSWMKLY